MNRLSSEPSLYLRQHAANPVHWQPWQESAWKEAKQRNVPVLISIGYSSCHWCHVMEREVFEKAPLAEAMNAALVCIKVDREERPDIDMIYMEAVQRMGLGGGWPLNVFCTPEGEPFYGGTYFPPANWAQVVSAIDKAWREHEGELRTTATEFRQALQEISHRPAAQQVDLEQHLQRGLKSILADADLVRGGIGGAPKFPLPGLYSFLLEAESLIPETRPFVERTLAAMAAGGICDHLGGGFFRYSTDAEWFAPHFEKMLYDNGQLLSLYARAFRYTGTPIYKEVADEMVAWLQREMTDASGAFYSSIDADSEGEEGRFYTWPAKELRGVLKEKYLDFAGLFNTTDAGNWEHGRNILALDRDQERPEYEGAHVWKERLLATRNERPMPGLDQKVLAAWNALATQGLAECYRFTGNTDALRMAVANAEYAQSHLWKEGYLLHQPDKDVEGYLDDYAAWALALTHLYEATFDRRWLDWADALTQQALHAFDDLDSPLLYYTAASAEKLLARKKEVNDSVIPSSNGMMALALRRLGILLASDTYADRADRMLKARTDALGPALRYGFTWGTLALQAMQVLAEIAIIGPEAVEWARSLDKLPMRNSILAASVAPSDRGMLNAKRPAGSATGAWLCVRDACLPPVYSLDKLQEELRVRGYLAAI